MTAFGSSASNGELFQNSFYIGINLENILYGIELFLYFKTMWALWNTKAYKKSNMFYVVLNSVMLFLITVWVATQALFGEKMWILDADFPGGPDEYWKANISIWYMDCGMIAVILLQLMTDALMIYRSRIICNNYRAVVIPIMLWLASLVLGIVVGWATSSPGGDLFTGLSAQLAFAYYTVSVVLNTTMTCMICYCMVWHVRMVQECLGHKHASPYFFVVALIVESMFPYTISGIAFLISLGIGSSTSVAFVSVYFLMMCLSPQMLILCVIKETARDDDAFKQPDSTLKFNPASTVTTQSLVTSGKNVYPPDGMV